MCWSHLRNDKALYFFQKIFFTKHCLNIQFRGEKHKVTRRHIFGFFPEGAIVKTHTRQCLWDHCTETGTNPKKDPRLSGMLRRYFWRHTNMLIGTSFMASCQSAVHLCQTAHLSNLPWHSSDECFHKCTNTICMHMLMFWGWMVKITLKSDVHVKPPLMSFIWLFWCELASFEGIGFSCVFDKWSSSCCRRKVKMWSSKFRKHDLLN